MLSNRNSKVHLEHCLLRAQSSTACSEDLVHHNFVCLGL
jgi:hypothetical protein